MKKIIAVVFVAMMIGLLGGCLESDYERAGKEFGSWINSDPNEWTDTQKDYFNNFMEWADEN